MRLLVTGGAGFIGAHFIRHWLAGHPSDEVVNLDCLTYAGSRARLADAERDARYRFIQGDITDAATVERALQGCQQVIHFAAETHVDRSITNAAPFLRTNVEGTYLLLQAARTSGVERFLHLSTDEVYGPVMEGAVDERAPLSPRSPYAASKTAGDLLAHSFHATYGLPVIVARPTNVYGPWQFPEKFMPLCITHALERLPIPIYGDGRQQRGWLFVTDLCEALTVILERGQVGDVYNIASGSEHVNRDVAGRILSSLGAPASLLHSVADRPGHDRRYAMTDEKAHALGWKPRMAFEDGMRETVTWYQAHSDWWRPLMQRLREDPYHWLNRPAGSGAEPSARRVG